MKLNTKTVLLIFFVLAVSFSAAGESIDNKTHPGIGPKPGGNVTITPGSVKKAAGGYTVAECYAMKKELKGKELAVRGIVVKFSSRIMGKNWLHIKDGAGYFYPVIIEDPSILVE